MGKIFTLVYTVHSCDLKKSSLTNIYDELALGDEFLNHLFDGKEIEVPELMVKKITEAAKLNS